MEETVYIHFIFGYFSHKNVIIFTFLHLTILHLHAIIETDQNYASYEIKHYIQINIKENNHGI